MIMYPSGEVIHQASEALIGPFSLADVGSWVGLCGAPGDRGFLVLHRCRGVYFLLGSMSGGKNTSYLGSGKSLLLKLF